MGRQTALFSEHQALKARIVDFGGWDMPVQYDSVLEEHHAVRRAAGMFDVSHMTFLELTGPDARPYLRRLLANDVDRLQQPGKALYSAMLREDGGVIDDLIVYAPTAAAPELWRVVVNCGTREKDLAWMQAQAAGFRVVLREREDLAMIAIQGPEARARVAGLKPAMAALIDNLGVFQGAEAGDWFVARTGYTGEDGLEILLPNTEAPAFWRDLLAAGVKPCGLGARDTLRLEAGMNLYGNDMDETVSPLRANMGWTLAWDHDFIGKAALEAEKAAGVAQRLVGLILEDKGVLRAHMKVFTADGEGETTSGTFSPTMERAIAFARVPAGSADRAEVEIRGKRLPARIVRAPFVRNGKALY
ncbi:MAG TPA: glycine cleavage system aminomethyltransferase GcvT [Moraxellaceae bacterium]|nr:glycine cleavage system aminomethyltransferase GcvT [Moraxellaceae bacterium]